MPVLLVGTEETTAQARLDALAKAGFVVKEPAEGHICCGSAGTYNLMQPEIAGQLKERKLGNLERTGAAVIAAGRIKPGDAVIVGMFPKYKDEVADNTRMVRKILGA